jgi:hypothetical protein
MRVLMRRTYSLLTTIGLVATSAAAADGQTQNYPVVYTVGYTTISGCSVGSTLITLPGGGANYLSGFGIGACWFGRGDGVNTIDVPTGWLGLGYGPPPAPPTDWFEPPPPPPPPHDESPPNFDRPPIFSNLVNSTDVGDPPVDPPGSPNDIVHNFVEAAPTTTTPEPASLVLFASGLAGVAGFAWRRRKN